MCGNVKTKVQFISQVFQKTRILIYKVITKQYIYIYFILTFFIVLTVLHNFTHSAVFP